MFKITYIVDIGRTLNDSDLKGTDNFGREYVGMETVSFIEKRGNASRRQEVVLLAGLDDYVYMFEPTKKQPVLRDYIIIASVSWDRGYFGIQIHNRKTGKMLESFFIQGTEAIIRTFGYKMWETAEVKEMVIYFLEYLSDLYAG